MAIHLPKAPILLFAYNRPDHLRKCLISLAACEGALESILHIFCDGPKPGFEEAVKETRKVARQEANGRFAEVRILEAAQNKGLSRSVIDGVSSVFETSDSVIVIEDDLVLSPYFIDYMNSALHNYESQNEVFSITAYCYPRRRFQIPPDFSDEAFLLPRIGSWGWATWKSRWGKAVWDTKIFYELANSENELSDYAKTGADKAELVKLLSKGEIDSWAIRWDYAAYKNGAMSLYPSRSLVQNIGFDNSGRHGKSYEQSLVHVDLSKRPIRLPEIPKSDERIISSYLRLYRKPGLLKRLKFRLLRIFKS